MINFERFVGAGYRELVREMRKTHFFTNGDFDTGERLFLQKADLFQVFLLKLEDVLSKFE